MIIKKLKLQNIRSYKEAIVDLPLGKTLFEGDIGCGKSTILMAIEFGLFGLGSEKGGSLLRSGEDEGSVSVIFNSNDVDYTVHRGLKRKKNSIQQTGCALKTPEGVTEYTPTELKEKILEILDFNEPQDPKAQSVIFRYAIYTPQEEMKTILALRPDLRMETLRKAFRMEDYKTATENSKELQSEIRQRAKLLSGLAEDIPAIRARIDALAGQIETQEKDLVLLRKNESDNRELLRDLKEKRDELHKKQLALKATAGKVDVLEKAIRDNQQESWQASQQIDLLQKKIKLITLKIEEYEGIKDPSGNTSKQIREEVGEFEKRERQLREEKTTIKVKVDEYKTIVDEGTCPTCDRPAEAHEFSDKMEEKEKQLDLANRSSDECTKQLELLRKLFESKRAFEESQSRLEGYRQNLKEYEDNTGIWKGKIESAERVIEDAKKELALVQADIEKLNVISESVKEISGQIEKAEEGGRTISSQISGSTTSIRTWRDEIEEREDEIKKKTGQKARSIVLNDYHVWIQDYFIPTLELIEKQVMTNINQEFDSQFQKWFGMLVDDTGKQAKVDEEFTPLIQQDGIDQEVSYLSGGEKTSVALAYRLALNNIVRKVSTGAHSNLLILDEPTDGFSKEQLGKVREILDEIKNPQIILVSHETELESFADQIYRITKEHGDSRIASDVTASSM